MVSKKVKRFVVKKDEIISNAYWRYSKDNKITIVVDKNDKFVGVIGRKEYEYAKKNFDVKDTIEEIINKDCKIINADSPIDIYMQARNIYAEYNIQYIPVVNDDNDVLDIFSLEKAFYKKYFERGKLERMHYAVCIMAAAKEAKELGYNAISVIEFGVAGGNGLLAAQMHAEEISRIFEIEIQVYGFDTGEGMPEIVDIINDMGHIYAQGFFKMNREKLTMQMSENTHLILGNIEDTLEDFFEKYNAPRIGVLFIDVDYYSSTKPILNWLGQQNAKFLPRVFMYFDDVSSLYEGVGEQKAIVEFNEENFGKMRISPEYVSDNIDWLWGVYGIKSSWMYEGYDYGKSRLKICHRYEQEDYVKESVCNKREEECVMVTGL